MSCPKCAADGVPSCSDGLGDPVHVAVVMAEVWDAVTALRVAQQASAPAGTLGAQIKTAPGARSANCEPESQGLADADRSAN